MPEFNRSERRALRLGTLLVLLGVAARLGLGPDADAGGGDGAGSLPGGDTALSTLRGSVDRNLDRARRAATPLAAGERLDPNTAPPVELERLPGVGPATAGAIVEERGRRPFRWAGDLREVRGIGPATLARIRPHLALPGRPPSGPRASPGAAPPARLDLNRATALQLESLPGVGPVLAAEIVAWRSRNGGFAAVDQLLEVRGIGPARLRRLRPRVRVR